MRRRIGHFSILIPQNAGQNGTGERAHAVQRSKGAG
jgi:hypothetical protein